MVKPKTFSVCVSCRCWVALFSIMMTSSNGNIFHVTGPLCGGIHRWLVNSPHKGQWRGALVFPLICGWADNCEADDLRRHCVHYAVSVMRWLCRQCNDSSEIATQNFIILRWKYNLSIVWWWKYVKHFNRNVYPPPPLWNIYSYKFVKAWLCYHEYYTYSLEMGLLILTG